MTRIKGNKKEGAIIQHTKTWGYRVIDYKNKINGKPCGTNHPSLEDAEIKYQNIISQNKINQTV